MPMNWCSPWAGNNNKQSFPTLSLLTCFMAWESEYHWFTYNAWNKLWLIWSCFALSWSLQHFYALLVQAWLFRCQSLLWPIRSFSTLFGSISHWLHNLLWWTWFTPKPSKYYHRCLTWLHKYLIYRLVQQPRDKLFLSLLVKASLESLD